MLPTYQYIVGSPIPVIQMVNRIALGPLFSKQPNPRYDISTKEILESFPHDQVMSFTSHDKAIEYANKQATFFTAHAVFKVCIKHALAEIQEITFRGETKDPRIESIEHSLTSFRI